ncbi:MAG TPA: response regulator [Polyangiaceae bacterium]|jgi:CheY-like chemotaxis protein|nr:response regulator [Polyangiaceae bacterium]
MPTLPPEPSAAHGATPEGPLVLVVEDDEDTRFLYAESLMRLGYRAAGESDARGGIEAAFRLRPDAILMDLAMPGMMGVEAIRILKADPRTSRCVIVVVTGSGMKLFAEARAAGCDAFFGKPFDPSALEHVLRALPSSPEPLVAALPRGVVKRCSCGREYTRNQWFGLPRCGRMHLARRDTVVELRNCACGSSLSLQLDDARDDENTQERDSGREVALEKVFVVDRDVNVRRLVLHFIGRAYVVEFLDDGYAALDRVRRAPPAALVAEVMIPRLDGVALCRLLKSDSSTAQVPVLLFSVLAANERARQAGADAFLAKPLEKESFLASLLGMMEPRRAGALPPRDASEQGAKNA